MYAIATLLDPPADQVVQDLWAQFEEHCGLTGVQVTPLPHFSWLSADSYQQGPVDEILTRMAMGTRPFSIHTAGLGIFTGSQPVIYISLVKDETLLKVHKSLWNKIRPFAIAPNIYYHPTRWVPHITLALREVEPARLGCAMADIAFQRIDLNIVVSHFSVIYQSDGTAGQKSRYEFGKGDQTAGGIP